jgi:hypothetical protein
MKTVDEILGMYRDRANELGLIHQQMRNIRTMANSDIIVPLNELDEHARASVANLMVQGLEQMSMRVGSVLPVPKFPPLRMSEKAKQQARDRREAMLGIWDQNRMGMKLRRRARHLLGYSESPVIIEPDFKNLRPRWRVINPLDVFPAPLDDFDDPMPQDCIIAWQQTYSWLMRNYPEQIPMLKVPKDCNPDTRFTLLQYIDAYEMTVIVKGSEEEESVFQPMKLSGHMPALRLEWTPNRCEMPLVVIPRRITLDKPRGQFDGMLNMFYTRARLQALNEIAIERGIFPDEYLVSRPGEVPEIIQVADGRTGQVGIVRGGELQQLQSNPGYKTDVLLDRIERQERLEGSIPADFGGESASNIRTGRRGENVLSATIDFRVQEAQALFQESLIAEDKIAIQIEKTYWGNTSKSFIVPGRAKDAYMDYTPNKLWESDEHYVQYPAAGSDINNLIIGLGQRLGTGLISKESAREADPLISDPELEHDRITAEGVEAALLASIQQQAAMPDGPYQPRDLANLVKKVTQEGKTLFQAIEEVDREAQERQAAEAAPGAPETMPGLAMPGMGAEVPEAVPEPQAGVSNLASMLSALRRPAAMAGAMG